MNMIFFFYNIFNTQELVLKFNNLNFKNIVNFKKVIVFNRNETNENKEKIEENKNTDILDYIHTFEFLTNIKVVKSKNEGFKSVLKLKKEKSLNVLLILNFLIFNNFTFISENESLEKFCPILNRKQKKKKKSILKLYKNYVDLEFRNGLDFSFLSKNEFLMTNYMTFFLRIVFNKQLKTEKYILIKELLWLSASGIKYVILNTNKKKKKGKIK